MMSKDQEDLAPWGYAPGSSFFHCIDCMNERSCIDDALHKGHKHSNRCIPHALVARLQELRTLEGTVELAAFAIHPPADVAFVSVPAEIVQADPPSHLQIGIGTAIAILMGTGIAIAIWLSF
jgi:hypothetical protein